MTMSLLQLRTPSFRSRLRLFFVAIVVVPMITMAVVLILLFMEAEQNQTEGRLSEAVTVSQEILREASVAAGDAAETIGEDQRLADARKAQDRRAIERRLETLRARTGAQYVELRLNGLGRFEVGDAPAMVPVSRGLLDQNEERTGSVTVSMVSPDSYAERIRRLTHAGVVVEQNGEQLSATGPATPGGIPRSGDVPDTDLTVSSFIAPEVGGNVRVKLLLPPDADAVGPDERESLLLAAVFIGFLVLAFLFAVAVSRSLQSEIQRVLEAARALGRGDFSVAVPEEGEDEFGELGKEFNSMARQLEARLDELQRERGRLQEAIRRVGESFAAGLDRGGLLEIVVQTAVDGTGATAGRASVRGANARLEEVTHTGEPEAFQRALHAAEAAVIDAGQVAEVQIGSARALAAPLGAGEDGGELIGIVSVARGDRPFTSGERELFAYLTNQASVSVENVDLHETVKRQAVTDELTGLFNHRRFQEVMKDEVERARRYGHELGLIMLDIDNFKQVNDTYGHLQGDMVLGEVARVLRQSAREPDEPARYGGEEMAVALPLTDLEGSYQFAERVRRRIEALDLPLLNGGGSLRVTASFGVASLATAGTADKDALVAAADVALYEAKRAGKNRTVRASVNAGLQRDVHGVASGE
jgi:diguanylate cyclase (GGDEF)-like protein